ncbi:MAG TPA: LysM peptidoglycan-binding domain-containing protein [Spirochaetota bacterium]|nr:LysM peptidoglycan-binding domain-containing protein [Spirochaetota bacterium]HPS87147.1 LysM peptidoglycan-binding domain-containing protein [Spirochaetota bacterium]
MSSYYKKINGKSYDKAMLDIADGSVAGKGDGRISLTDSRSIVKQIKDGGKITDIERRTLNYILENYKLTETALKHIEKSISVNLVSDVKNEIKAERAAAVREEIPQMGKQPAKGGWGKKLFIFLILLLLAIFAVFTFFKYFYKNTKTDNAVTEKHDEVTAIQKDETAVSKTESAEKTGAVPVKPLTENEYLVKDKDTLIKISEALYGDYKKWEDIYKLNKSKIANPTILYPGQILQLPEKTGNK